MQADCTCVLCVYACHDWDWDWSHISIHREFDSVGPWPYEGGIVKYLTRQTLTIHFYLPEIRNGNLKSILGLFFILSRYKQQQQQQQQYYQSLVELSQQTSSTASSASSHKSQEMQSRYVTLNIDRDFHADQSLFCFSFAACLFGMHGWCCNIHWFITFRCSIRSCYSFS